MTRINSTSNSGPQPIPSQDSAAQNVSETQTQKTQQQSGVTEQQQNKQAAQGRKSEIDLQGAIKQSQLAQFHGPGGSHSKSGRRQGNVSGLDDSKSQQIQDAVRGAVAGAVVAGPAGALSGAMVNSVPKDSKQIEFEKWYYDMMKMEQMNRGIPGEVTKPTDDSQGGMRMSPMEVEKAKNAEKAKKAQKVKDAVEPIITGTIVGGPAGAAIGSIISGTPILQGEQKEIYLLNEGQRILAEGVQIEEGKKRAEEAANTAEKMEQGGFDSHAEEVLQKQFPTANEVKQTTRKFEEGGFNERANEILEKHFPENEK